MATGKTDFIMKTGSLVLTPREGPTDSQNYTSYVFDQWFCKPLSPEDKCADGIKINITITNSANPFVQSSVFTDSFVIQVRSLDNNQV